MSDAKPQKSKVEIAFFSLLTAGAVSGCVTTGSTGGQQASAPVDFRTAQPTYSERRTYASNSAPIYGAPVQNEAPQEARPSEPAPSIQPEQKPYAGPFSDPFSQPAPGLAPSVPAMQTAVLTIPPADVGAPIEVEAGDTLFALSERCVRVLAGFGVGALLCLFARCDFARFLIIVLQLTAEGTGDK